MLRELNKESLLLLYRADELSAEDRAEVDRMLAADAGFRAELERLDAAMGSFESGMAVLDARPLPTETVTSRRIGSAMRRHMAERMARPAPEPVVARRGLRYPWWAYPTAAAAAILIAFLGIWGHQPDGRVVVGPPDLSPVIPMPGIPGDRNNHISPDPTQVAGAEDTTQVAEMGDDFENGNSTQPEKSVVSLDLAERHLAELTRSRDRMVPSAFGFNDSNE